MNDETVNGDDTVLLGLPKGRMWDGVSALLRDAGLPVRTTSRQYRPLVGFEGLSVKMLKPQNIVEMLHAGSRDLGFAGADWVEEKRVDLVELLDTGLDPVRVVAAAPASILQAGRLPDEGLTIATEYQALGAAWLERTGRRATLVRSYGATEVFPPEDADAIIDNTATGATLEANGLVVTDVIMRSTTRLYAHPAAMENPAKRPRIEALVLLLRSVLDARRRVMLEVNIAGDRLAELVGVLPAMRQPTVSPLHGNGNFAVKVAAPRRDLPELIPLIKAHGGTDIVITNIAQIVP